VKLESHESIEIKWRALQLQVEKDPPRMCQDFPNQAMLKMPQIVHPQAGYGKALGQMRAHGFHSLPQAGAGLEQSGTMGGSPPFTRGGHDKDPMTVRQHGLTKGIDEASVRWHQPGKPGDPVVQQLDVMGPGGQERATGDHPTAREAQSQLKAIVVQLLGGTVALISKRLEAAVAATAGVATHGQRQGINDLDGIGGLPTDLGQPLLNGGFDLPEVRGLTDKERALLQVRKEVGVGGAEVPKEVLVGSQLEILATDLQGEDFFIAQRGGKPAAAQGVEVLEHLIMLTNQTVDSNDKLIAIHWGPPAGNSWCGNPYSTARLLNRLAA